MAIMPKFKPGQLVQWGQGPERLIGLVKSTQLARRRGEPVFVLVQWCSNKQWQQEEYVPQKDLKLVEEEEKV